jgi:hypothetical protein
MFENRPPRRLAGVVVGRFPAFTAVLVDLISCESRPESIPPRSKLGVCAGSVERVKDGSRSSILESNPPSRSGVPLTDGKFKEGLVGAGNRPPIARLEKRPPRTSIALVASACKDPVAMGVPMLSPRSESKVCIRSFGTNEAVGSAGLPLRADKRSPRIFGTLVGREVGTLPKAEARFPRTFVGRPVEIGKPPSVGRPPSVGTAPRNETKLFIKLGDKAVALGNTPSADDRLSTMFAGRLVGVGVDPRTDKKLASMLTGRPVAPGRLPSPDNRPSIP